VRSFAVAGNLSSTSDDVMQGSTIAGSVGVSSGRSITVESAITSARSSASCAGDRLETGTFLVTSTVGVSSGFRCSSRLRYPGDATKRVLMLPPPIGSIASLNASLTIVLFDARTATDWVPTKPAATKAQFTGHPAEIMRGLSKGEELCAVDIGASGGFAFELEGTSGRLEAYRLAEGTLALVAPPRAWWVDPANHGDHAAEIDALFEQALGTAGVDDATEVGTLELTSGKLAAVYLWMKKVGAARDLAATVPSGGALAFGDGYGDGNSGLIVDLGPGSYQLRRGEIAAPWDADRSLVVMYLVREN
jgi:hypothetical protein